MQYQLGSLEETALLLVASADPDEAYAYAMTLQYEKHLGTSISISALHTVLKGWRKRGSSKAICRAPARNGADGENAFSGSPTPDSRPSGWPRRPERGFGT